jgi:hypothetical protein
MFRLIIAITILAMLVPAHSVHGQPQASSLQACLADNTSGKDRKDLARWIFLALSAHPEMKQYVNAGAPTAADESSRTVAALVTHLIADSCPTEAKAAMKGGGQALTVAFEGLGRLAIQELMADKSTNESLSQFSRYLDQKRLQEALVDK